MKKIDKLKKENFIFDDDKLVLHIKCRTEIEYQSLKKILSRFF